MNRSAFKSTTENYQQEEQLVPYVPISPALRMNWTSGVLEISSSFTRADHGASESINIFELLLPPSPINDAPISLLSRIDLCILLIAVVDQYLLSTRPSKSRFSVARHNIKNCAKLFEYMWLHGFYRPGDMPREAWEDLAEKLSSGGWEHALEIPKRTAILISKIENLNLLYGNFRKSAKYRNVSENFNKYLGSNIRYFKCVSSMLSQAAESDVVRISGDIDRYETINLEKTKASVLSTFLVSLNRLMIPNIEGAPSIVPFPGAYSFSMRKGLQGDRTANLTPDAAAKLLVYSFDWVINKGAPVVDLLEDISESLLATIEQKTSVVGGGVPLRKIAEQKLKILSSSEKIAAVEKIVGKRVLTFHASRKSNINDASLLDLINQLASSCFVIIAFLNARRKDEIRHPVIGLHAKSLQIVDESLQLYRCEFYIEKTMRDYDTFWVTEISKRAINIMERIASVAWRWSEVVGGRPPPEGRDRKLFVVPLFSQTGRGYRHFDFVATKSEIKTFLADALQGVDESANITPHMLRRGYGLIYHYRYENSSLAALGRKYRHVDLIMPLHYVTNGLELAVGGHAAAIWSAPQRTILEARREQEKNMLESINSVGREKLESFVEDVISGEKRFGGGFAKIVHRFNRFFAQQIDYGQLNKKLKTKALTETLLSRGHIPHPYPHATCMAGQARNGAACAKNGTLAREIAGPVVCGGCKYSSITAQHITFMEEEVERLSSESDLLSGTLRGLQLSKDLQNIKRIISLQRARLEASNDA